MVSVLLIVILTLYFNSSYAEQKKFNHPYEKNLQFDTDIVFSKNDENLNNEALSFYLRLVKHILKKERFKPDPHDDDFFIANIPLKVNKIQYDLLIDNDINGLNIQEIDEVLEEILMQSKTHHSIPQILFDYYRQEIIGSIPTLSAPVLLLIISLICIIVVNHLFKFSKLSYSAIIFFTIACVCIVSYIMTYHDCLNDLEVEQMIQLSKENTLNNPCKNFHGEKESTLSFIKSMVFGSYENECLEHMRKTFKPSKKYCDPLDVFARWTAKIQMSYISSVTEDFFGVLTKFTSSSNILTKAVVWIASTIFFGLLIISILKVVVSHLFQGTFSFLSTSPTTPKDEGSLGELNSKMDAILTENLHMKRELSMIRELSEERILKISPPRSKKQKLNSIKETSQCEDDSSES